MHVVNDLFGSTYINLPIKKESLLFLKSINFSGPGISLQTLQYLIENSPNLEELALIHEPSISDEKLTLQTSGGAFKGKG